jgi:hypothetical protein
VIPEELEQLPRTAAALALALFALALSWVMLP